MQSFGFNPYCNVDPRFLGMWNPVVTPIPKFDLGYGNMNSYCDPRMMMMDPTRILGCGVNPYTNVLGGIGGGWGGNVDHLSLVLPWIIKKISKIGTLGYGDTSSIVPYGGFGKNIIFTEVLRKLLKTIDPISSFGDTSSFGKYPLHKILKGGKSPIELLTGRDTLSVEHPIMRILKKQIKYGSFGNVSPFEINRFKCEHPLNIFSGLGKRSLKKVLTKKLAFVKTPYGKLGKFMGKRFMGVNPFGKLTSMDMLMKREVCENPRKALKRVYKWRVLDSIKKARKIAALEMVRDLEMGVLGVDPSYKFSKYGKFIC